MTIMIRVVIIIDNQDLSTVAIIAVMLQKDIQQRILNFFQNSQHLNPIAIKWLCMAAMLRVELFEKVLVAVSCPVSTIINHRSCHLISTIIIIIIVVIVSSTSF